MSCHSMPELYTARTHHHHHHHHLIQKRYLTDKIKKQSHTVGPQYKYQYFIDAVTRRQMKYQVTRIPFNQISTLSLGFTPYLIIPLVLHN